MNQRKEPEERKQAICLRKDLELKVSSKYFTTPHSDVIVIMPHNERGLVTQQKRAIKHIAWLDDKGFLNFDRGFYVTTLFGSDPWIRLINSESKRFCV